MSLKSKFYSVFLGLAVALLLAAGCSSDPAPGPKENNVAQAPPQAPASIPEDEPVAQVAAQVEPSVVQVNVSAAQETPFGSQEDQSGVGSGVIYREDGFIVTNNHVVADAEEVSVAFADGSTEQGQVVGNDPRTDLAVVRVDRNDLPAADFVEENDLIPGQLAVAIGSPSGFESTVTAGVISGLNREIPPELTGGQLETALVDLVQTDAAISPGNSGGGLADRSGQVVGINVAYLPPNQTGAINIGFAIPSDTAISVADQLIESGETSRAFLGVRLTDLSAQEAEEFGLQTDGGAIVDEVTGGSAAGDAGVRVGDIITALEDRSVEDSGDLLGALRDYQPGDTVQLTIIRDGNEQTLEVTLDEAPSQ